MLTTAQKNFIYEPNGKDCPVCGILAFAHEHPPNTKPKDFIVKELKNVIKKRA